MIAIDDPDLPGLGRLDAADLARITGVENVSLLRLRYRPGGRAILHLSAEGREGTLWLFKGDKARRLARQTTDSVYDRKTRAFYETFPRDHRLPQIYRFVTHYAKMAPLIGGLPIGTPELLRYRPGISCTFRCERSDGQRIYVKLNRETPAAYLAQMNAQLAERLGHRGVAVPRVIGFDETLSAVAYSEAQGRPLDQLLADSHEPLDRTVEALRGLWTAKLTPPRLLDSTALAMKAADACHMISLTLPGAAPRALHLLQQIASEHPPTPLHPIHGDMKPEHVFVSPDRITLVDTESLSLGPQDYDLAQLCSRIWQAADSGLLAETAAREAEDRIRGAAGPAFDWCLRVAALRVARFHAQRPSPEAAGCAKSILSRLA